jgi:hypothetical protein
VSGLGGCGCRSLRRRGPRGDAFRRLLVRRFCLGRYHVNPLVGTHFRWVWARRTRKCLLSRCWRWCARE